MAGYYFTGRTGELISIAGASTEFDVTIVLFHVGADSLELVETDDDGGLGSDAHLSVRLPHTGLYMFGVSAYEEKASAGANFAVHALRGSALPAHGASSRWVRVNGSAQLAVYVDRTTIEKRSGYYLTWVERRYSEPQVDEDGDRYDRSVQRAEIDCARRRSRLLTFTWYLGGRVVYSSNRLGAWHEWIPESVGESTYAGACTVAAGLGY